MRRTNVDQRSAPRVARSEVMPPAARPVEVARGISRTLPNVIDEAWAAGLDSSADVLEVARAEAERAMEMSGIVVNDVRALTPWWKRKRIGSDGIRKGFGCGR